MVSEKAPFALSVVGANNCIKWRDNHNRMMVDAYCTLCLDFVLAAHTPMMMEAWVPRNMPVEDGLL